MNANDVSSPSSPERPRAWSVARLAALWAALLGLAAAVDTALGEQATPAGVLWSLPVGIAAGGLLGALLGAVRSALYYVPRWACLGSWSALGLALGFWLTHALGILARLGGEYHTLALAALGATLVAALGGAALGLGLQPRPATPKSWLVARPRTVRIAAAIVLGVAALGMAWLDRRWLAGEYPQIRVSLRLGALIAVTAAGQLLLAPRRLPAVRGERWALLGLVVLGLVPLALLRSPGALAQIAARPYSSLALGTLRGVFDLDRDGYSALLGGGDCNDLNRRVHPKAEEIPQNGLDDNCRFGDARSQAVRYDPERVPRAAAPAPRSVVLITSDSLSALHMSAHGYRRNTTPNIARWAAQHALVFERAYSASTSTALSVGGSFRGVYPRRLSWTKLPKTTRGRMFRVTEQPKLRRRERIFRYYVAPIDEWRKPLSWWLLRRELPALAIVDDGTSRFMEPWLGIGGPFDEYVDADTFPRAERNDQGLVKRALARLERIPSGQRFFLWLHFFGTHTPSTRHRGVPVFGSSPLDDYDHEIAAFDRDIAPLLEALVERQKHEPLAVILSSDHGEEFTNKRTHGYTVNQSVVRVPLMISLSGVPPRRTRDLASTVDLMPTVLGLTGTPAPPGLDGIDLSPALQGAALPGSRVVLAEGWAYDANGEIVSDQILATDGEYRLVRDFVKSTQTLEHVGRLERGQDARVSDLERPALEERLGRYLDENAAIKHDAPTTPHAAVAAGARSER